MLVAAHGNSLRALVKHLDQISDEDIAGLNIPTGMPLVYELDDDMTPTVRGGRYLDPDAAAEAAARPSRTRVAESGPRRSSRDVCRLNGRLDRQKSGSTLGQARWPRGTRR